MLSSFMWFCGVVVITSASHAEGREFDPRQNLCFFRDQSLIMRGEGPEIIDKFFGEGPEN